VGEPAEGGEKLNFQKLPFGSSSTGKIQKLKRFNFPQERLEKVPCRGTAKKLSNASSSPQTQQRANAEMRKGTAQIASRYIEDKAVNVLCTQEHTELPKSA
jgi:hypothetical protein